MLKMAENSAEERRKRARVCEARSEKSAREREKAEKESKRAANEKKIERLKTARDSIQSQKIRQKQSGKNWKNMQTVMKSENGSGRNRRRQYIV